MDASNADLGLAFQGSKGTAAAASAYRFPLTAGLISPAKVNAVPAFVTPNIGGVQGLVDRISVAGAPGAFARPNMIGALFYGALGAKTVTGSVDPWTHTFTLAANRPWITFWSALAGSLFEQFVDCKLASLEVAGAAGRPITVLANVLGITPRSRTAGSTAVGIEAGSPFLHWHGAGALLVEGLAVSSLETWKLTITTGVRASDSINGVDVVEGPASILLETTQIPTDFSLWNRLHYGAAVPADSTAGTTTLLALAGSPAGVRFTFTLSATRSLQIALPTLEVTDIADFVVSTRTGTLRQTVNYRASGSAPISVVVRNGMSGY